MKIQSSTRAKNHPLIAWLLFPFSLFPLVALITYDACTYTMFPAAKSTNWVGALGDFFAHYGYLLFGLAIWGVPLLFVLAGLCMLRGEKIHAWRRWLWFTALLAGLSCMAQVIGMHGGPLAMLAEKVNIDSPGGAIGYLAMTRFLSPLLSDFGSSILISIFIVVSLIAAIGAHNFGAFFVAVWHWAIGYRAIDDEQAADGDEAMPADEDPYQAIKRAREEAKRQREEEKRRAREEKQRLKEEKLRVKAEAKAAALEEARQERERREAEIQQINAVREAAALDNAGVKTKPEPAPVPDKGPYLLPSLSLLKPLKRVVADHSDVGEMSRKLIDTLKLFDINAEMSFTVQGPVVTKYAILLEPGTKYSVVTAIQDNLMGALHATSLRIEAPIPGKEEVGIEVPNRSPAGISFREIMESEAWRNLHAELPLLFGRRADGQELVADLAAMPHMLVAGATGQGKSVCLNSLICGLLMSRTPDQLKLIMVDPKCVEFTPYAAIPHLLVPVITENKKVVFSLHWAVAEMEKRLKLFARARVKNISEFNHRPQLTQTDMFGDDCAIGTDMPRTLPYIVIIIDEAADLIGQCGKDVNPDIQRITQKARAAGIHLILATQRPDAKIITGTIKANIPGRVAFKTSTAIDSRTILDDTGAENLIGKGDMLFKAKDNNLIRAQGAWISNEEIANITRFIEEHSNTDFDDRFTKKLSTIKEEEIDIFADDNDGGKPSAEAAAEAREQVKAEENAGDFKKAVECIINTNRASTSHFQRKLGWGYNHSAKIMDMLEDAKIIGPQVGAGPRQIIMDQQQLMAIFNGDANAAETAEPASEETLENSSIEGESV